MNHSFSHYHPVVNFTYFALVLICAMFFMHPVCLAVSLMCSFAYSVQLNGKRALKFNLAYMLPLLLVSVLLNPAFNHEGITVLTYLPDGNPLTLESVAYGIAAACMIVSVISWFSCYNAVMTSDKFLYLFGRVIPALSLIFSMVLRFVPRFKAQVKVVSDAQKCIGRDVSNGSVLQRARHGLTILSILVTWALENAIETADSMKSRGYGRPGRTAFSIFVFDSRDKKAMLAIGLAGLYTIIGAFFGAMDFRFFPSMQGAGLTLYSVSVFAAYFILCVIPMAIELWEDRKWKAMK
ncbi:MAG TPA: energy-coupling factor transporter transmembrane protein EcfT [Candidatus Aphodoplasma excrementigallinarum]|uniref:Energy-coupling factor transporter transmembrane protein EcfT n=1 Tax=Candidatus Aphodoplasma excrementigallinarum TaxID=2840673 RepID=A0A9D1NHD9_9FIRM|nr:energy-coupling factor transporter transmembrane protein EcfT [Candidatus Aphodoplasma excrementigallinarum]